MKVKILLLVILLALIPQASAIIFINQTSTTTSQPLLSGGMVGQNFTTPSYANASIYNLDYVEVYAAKDTPGTQNVMMSISNYTNTFTSSNVTVTFSGVAFALYRFNFTGIYLASNVNDYNFTLSLPAGGSRVNIAMDGAGNPYSGGNVWVDNLPVNNADLTFNMSLSPHDTVGNWTLDQGSGAYANDSSGFNNNGTLSGVAIPTWATNLVNGSVNSTALSFGGSSSYVNVPTNSALNITNDITLSGWILPRDITTFQGIVSKATGADATVAYEMDIYNGNMRFYVGNGASRVGTTNPITANTWQYFVGRVSGNEIVLFKNAVPDGTTTFTGTRQINSRDLMFGDYATDAHAYFNGTMDEIKIFNYALNTSEITTEYQRFQPVPAYPVGGITLPAVYPPLQTPVTFSWHDTVYPADEIQIAQDSNFNIMVHDGFHSTDSATVNLNAGQTYYWRILQYNSTTGTFGATSATQTFTISSAPAVSASGASIQGIVYEIINGVQTPISGSIVYLSNSSTSMTFVTSSNGYFLFQNLAPSSTYTIYATNAPVYNPSSPVYVTTEAGASTVTSNILLTRFFSPFVPNYVYEKFIVRNLFDTRFPGVTVQVFEDGNLVPTFSKTTDTMGQAVFQLIKDTYYRVEFSGGGLSNTITIFTYGKEEEYEVLVLSGVPSTNVTTSQVFANLTYSAVNATFTNLTLIYNDGSLSTSQVNFFVYNVTTGSPVLLSYQTYLSGNNSFTAGYAVSSGGGTSYVWGYNATTQYGFQEGAKAITFPSGVSIPVSSTIKNWISIILLVILVSMFSVRNIKLGAVVVPIFAWILYFFSWLSTNPLLISVVTVLGVLVYMRKSEIKIEV